MPGTLPPAPQGSDRSVSDLPTQRVKATLPPAPEKGPKETPAPAAPPATRKGPRAFLLLAAATVIVALVGVSAALLSPALRAKITIPAASAVYHQSLINPASGWPNSGDCQFTSSGYEVGGPSVCFYGAQDVRDATVSVTMTRASGDDDPSAGVAFRRTGPGAFYTFEIDGNGNWAVYKGKTILQQGESDAILTGVGAQNTLQAQMKGSHFTFSVNGIQVAQADDTAFATGKVGLTGFTGLKVVYTNFTIAPL